MGDPLLKRHRQRPLRRNERVAVDPQLTIRRRVGQYRRRLVQRITPGVLRAGEMVDPHIRRNIEITLATGIRSVRRPSIRKLLHERGR
jgi:hypothetical protein